MTQRKKLFGAAAAGTLSGRTWAVLFIATALTLGFVRIGNLLGLCLRARCASTFAGCTTTDFGLSAAATGSLV